MKRARLAFVNELKGENRVALEVKNIYMFLFRDGTYQVPLVQDVRHIHAVRI